MTPDQLYALAAVLFASAFCALVAFKLARAAKTEATDQRHHEPSGVYIRVEADREMLAREAHAANGRAQRLSALLDVSALELGKHDPEAEKRLRKLVREICGEKAA